MPPGPTINLDYFRMVDDSYSHAFRDMVLARFAETLKKNRSDASHKLQVIVSIGISSLNGHRLENHTRRLIMAAQALYRAWAMGRNRAEVCKAELSTRCQRMT